LLLEINNTLVSNLKPPRTSVGDLNLSQTGDAARRCGLALLDPAINKLRVTALEFPANENVFVEDEIIDLEGLPGGSPLPHVNR